MPITIPAAYVDTFESTVRQLAQQKTSRIRSAVTEVNRQSQSHMWDRLAASDYRTKTPRAESPAGGDGSGAIGTTDGLDWSRRNTLIQTFDTGEIVGREEIVQMLIDPKSAVAENLAMNMKRAVDDVIIDNFFSDALTDGGTAATFPTSQAIDESGNIITMDMLLNVKEIFALNDVDMDERITFVIGPRQQRALMQLLEVTSGDYQNSKALATGYLPNFLGLDIIVSNRLTTATTNLECAAFTRRAMGLHVASDISANVAERPDMSFDWQLYCSMQMNAVRVEDEHIVKLTVDNQ
jgi:hypothetical protein